MKAPSNVTQKLIQDHLISGKMEPGEEIEIAIDHVLQQDATGTLIMLELEALGLNEVKSELAVQYVDHNLLQTDFRNADDHKFLRTSASKLGYYYSRPGNGISHVVHMEQFGIPGKSMLGSDSHSCAGGGLGMLAIGTGGLDVALAATGEPYFIKMPRILGVELTNKLSDWVSAKDIVLEMLRRYDVKGCKDVIIEYYGEGVETLSTWDRHVIANMGTEMGATTSVFPSDENTRFFMKQQGREDEWQELEADKDARYDMHETIDLSKVVPLIACPGSPGNVVTVEEVSGREVSQVVVGSSANPGYRDFWIVASILKNEKVRPGISLDINPSSRQIIQNLVASGQLNKLMSAGARFHQTGCLGCIGMGQSPASGTISLRTMPRNFKGRSGTEDDEVYLCSPETAAASAITGKITDPRTLEKEHKKAYPNFQAPAKVEKELTLIQKPGEEPVNKPDMGDNIKPFPNLEEIQNEFSSAVILKMADNISTDEILKAGAEVLPLRSNIPEISKYAFTVVDKGFYDKAIKNRDKGHIVIAGENYAQGSSREHAALAPRYLGQRAVIAKSYARIGWQNLINFGIIPLEFVNKDDYENIEDGDCLKLENIHKALKDKEPLTVFNETKDLQIQCDTSISERQMDILLAGGLINYMKNKNGN